MQLPEPMPPAPEASFASDNTAGVAPAVMEALVAANTRAAMAYGADQWSATLNERFGELLSTVLRKLGASVTLLAAGEIFPNLEKGVIDGTEPISILVYGWRGRWKMSLAGPCSMTLPRYITTT